MTHQGSMTSSGSNNSSGGSSSAGWAVKQWKGTCTIMTCMFRQVVEDKTIDMSVCEASASRKHASKFSLFCFHISLEMKCFFH